MVVRWPYCLGGLYNPKVSVLSSSKGDINQLCVCHQDLMCLLDGSIVGFVNFLRKGGGQEPLGNGTYLYVSQYDFSTNC